MPGIAAVSVDLDSLRHYCRIHSLPETDLDPDAENLVYRLALPRFRELFSELKIHVTFFAIGEDLDNSEAALELRRASEKGHEIGNHSQTHNYRLARQQPEEIESELAAAAASIERAVGQPPVGFRAPGYTLSSALYQALCRRNYWYDSSAFPAVPYYLAKALVMGGLAAVRRPSQAILDHPAVLLAPRSPYLPDPQNPYRRGIGPVIELPIATTRWTRFPLIGTFVAALPPPITRSLLLGVRDQSFFNFELHAIDLLDQYDGIPSALVHRQRDLGVPYASKMQRIHAALKWICAEYEVIPLREVALRLRPTA